MKRRQQITATKIAAACLFTALGLLASATLVAQQPGSADDYAFSPIPPMQTSAPNPDPRVAPVSFLEENQPGSVSLIGSADRSSEAKIRTEPKVVPLSGTNLLNPIEGPGIQPTSMNADAESVRVNQINDLYTLVRRDWRDLENMLVDCWGSMLSVSTNEDGRFAQVQIPLVAQGATIRMMIDRMNNQVIYQGDDRARYAWQRLISSADRGETNSVVKLIPVTAENCGHFVRVAYTMGFQEDQDNPPTADDVLNMVQDSGQNDRPVIVTRPGTGPAKITFDKDLGLIILTGDADKVAEIKDTLTMALGETAQSMATYRRIPLENQQSVQLAEPLQEAYDQAFAGQLGAATIRPLSNPNSLIAIGSAKAIETIAGLAESMDVVAPAETPGKDYQAIRLVYISVIDAKQRVDEFFGVSQGAGAVQRDPEVQPPAQPVVTIADPRSNTLFIKAAPIYIEQAIEFLKEIDVSSTPDGARDLVRVVKLKNADAGVLVQVIMDAISGQIPNSGVGNSPGGTLQQQSQGGFGGGGGIGATGAQQNVQPAQPDPNGANLRMAQLELATITANGEEIDGGIMFDVRITADVNSNSLIVTASRKSMPLVLELIRQLDTLPDAETQIKVFEIINGDATRLFELLSGLLGGNAQGGQGGQIGGATGANSAFPIQSASFSEGGTLINMRFAVDERTNTIIASGPVGDLEVVYELLNRLDVDDRRKRVVEVYRLSNAPVLDVQETLQNWLDQREEALAGVLTTTTSQFDRRVIVEAEQSSNQLLVTALPEYLPEIERVIKALDRRPPMVKVKVMIVEVQLGATDEFGIEVGVQDSILFDRGISTIGFPFNQEALGNEIFARENLAGQALSNLALGRINSELGYGGLVLSAGNESVNLLLRALQDSRCGRVLSKPHLMTIENLQGRVQVGSRVPFVTGVEQNQAGGISNSVEFEDVGVILAITPRVSPDGMVVMFVDVTNSQLGDVDDGIPIFVSEGQVITSPQIDTITAQTAVMARSGQTVVFSGLIQERKAHVERGAPILKDLPGIGPFFRFESDSTDRRELLIFLTPQVTDRDNVLDQVNTEEMDRMHWCESDLAEIYGAADYNLMHQTSGATRVVYPDESPAGIYPQINKKDNAEGGYGGTQAEQPGFENNNPQWIPSGNSAMSNVEDEIDRWK